MSGKLKYLVALVLPAAGLVLASGSLPSLLTGGSGAFVYDTADVTEGSIRKVVSTSGTVRALVTVSVGSQLSGQIRELKVDFNSEVTVGEVLVVMDDKMFAAKVAQVTADLAAANAMLTVQHAALVKAEAIERNAGRLMRRQQTLADRGVVAATALDAATRDVEVARADIEVAKAQVENAKAVIVQRQSQLLQAQIDLERTRIRSPIDGTVIGRTVDIGQTVAASLQAPELFKIAQDLRRISIEAQVSEADIGAVAEGNAVEFVVDAYPERRFQGRVAQVRLGATELNNVVTYTVIIQTDNNERKLLPGMTVNARIESARADKVLRVPNDALRFRPRNAATDSKLVRDQATQRLHSTLDRAKVALALTAGQAARIADIVRDTWAEQRPNSTGGSAIAFSGSPPPPGGETERRMFQRLKHAIASVITEAQRSAFETWKAQLDGGRGGQRDAMVWLLDASEALESRLVEIGLADDHYTEVRGGGLNEGDRVVLRSRKAGKI